MSNPTIPEQIRDARALLQHARQEANKVVVTGPDDPSASIVSLIEAVELLASALEQLNQSAVHTG